MREISFHVHQTLKIMRKYVTKNPNQQAYALKLIPGVYEGKEKTRKNKNRRKAIFNWAAKGLFLLKGGGGYTLSGYYKTLSPTIA